MIDTSLDPSRYNADLVVITQLLNDHDDRSYDLCQQLQKQIITSLGMKQSRSSFTLHELAAGKRSSQPLPISPEWVVVKDLMGCSRIIDHQCYLIQGRAPTMILSHTYVPESVLSGVVAPLERVGLAMVEFGLGSYYYPEGARMLGLCKAETAERLGSVFTLQLIRSLGREKVL
jgi:hypothetical protein